MSTFILVVGDVHGNFGELNALINKKIRQNNEVYKIVETGSKVMILQCGDMAFFWPRKSNINSINNRIDFLPDKLLPIYWCGGNHEDWDTLDNLFVNKPEDLMAEVAPAIYFCRCGATLELSDKITVLFAGGAISVDRYERINYQLQTGKKCWWQQEKISQEDRQRLLAIPKADWIISHTSPKLFNANAKLPYDDDWSEDEKRDISQNILNEVLLKYKPRKWFFGHFHHYLHGKYKNCQWYGLSSIDDSGQSARLEILK